MPTGKTPHKILIVEDEAQLVKAYRSMLEDDGEIAVIAAATLEEALAAFEANPDVELIAVDGCFPHAPGGPSLPEHGRKASGEKFVSWLRGPRAGYAGTILACSSVAFFNQRMLEAGATRTCEKGPSLCQLIQRLLHVPPAAS